MDRKFRTALTRPDVIVHNFGLALHGVEARCAHGHLATGITLIGHKPYSHTEMQQHLVVPRCVFTELFGTLLAQISQKEGEQAAEAFRQAARDAEHTAGLMYAALARDGRTCCAAGFTTHGREHTCDTSRT
jgi:hypothetical protein